MERNEKEHILTNKESLLEHTKCNPFFLSAFEAKRILSRSDIEEINGRNGDFSMANKFYDTIIQRKGAYTVLLYALEKTSQTGALETLQKLKNDEGVHPLVEETGSMASHCDGDAKVKRAIVIGSDECCTADIVEGWQKSSVAAKLVNEWRSLARKLRIPNHVITQNHNKIQRSELNAFDVTVEILDLWVDKAKEEATVGALIDVLEAIDWNEYARCVKDHVGIPR